MQLNGQTVVVTGAGRGIGRAIAEICAAEGAQVALVSRTRGQLEETASAITAAGGTALALPTDVADAEAVAEMVGRVEASLGPVDLLVNNAAAFAAVGPVWEVDPDVWWQDVTVNVRGVFLCARAVVAGMVARGQGRIINLIGGGTDRPFPYGSGYATSKAAVMRLTECLAAETKELGVSVFAMGPGLVRTAMTEYQMKTEAGQRWFPHIGQRFQEGADVPPTRAAALAVLLASGRFDGLTGRAFNVSDDMEAVAENAQAIVTEDLHTLRMRRLA